MTRRMRNTSTIRCLNAGPLARQSCAFATGKAISVRKRLCESHACLICARAIGRQRGCGLPRDRFSAGRNHYAHKSCRISGSGAKPRDEVDMVINIGALKDRRLDDGMRTSKLSSMLRTLKRWSG